MSKNIHILLKPLVKSIGLVIYVTTLGVSYGQTVSLTSTSEQYRKSLQETFAPYFDKSISNGVDGYCSLNFHVNEDGAIKDIKVKECNIAGLWEQSLLKSAGLVKERHTLPKPDYLTNPGIQEVIFFRSQNKGTTANPPISAAVPSVVPANMQMVSVQADTPKYADGFDHGGLICPPVTYPEANRMRQEEGSVHILGKLTIEGKIEELLIEKSSGFFGLDQAVLDQVKKCKVIPATTSKTPAKTTFRQKFNFKLEGSSSKSAPSDQEKLRQDNFRRIAGLAPKHRLIVTEQENIADYAQSIARKVKPFIIFTGDITGNPAATVDINCTDDGNIIGLKLSISSGNKEWDNAVLNAVTRASPFPLGQEGKAPKNISISFRPRE